MTLRASEVAAALIDADLVALGRRIRAERIARDLTQQELAEPAGVSAAYISRIEDGSRRLRYPVLVAIATTLGLPPTELLDLNTSPRTVEDLKSTLTRVLRSIQRLPVNSVERVALETEIVLYASKAMPRLLALDRVEPTQPRTLRPTKPVSSHAAEG